MLLKNAIVCIAVFVEVVLGSFLVRDFRRGIIFTHLGTYRRNEQRRAFWFWTTNYFVLLFLALCATIAAVFLLPSS